MNDNRLFLILYFGWLNLAVAASAACLWIWQPHWLPYNGHGMGFTLILQGVVAAAMIFAVKQRQAGTLLGSKAFPATMVAYGLFLLMALRWLAQG
ncbi:hypothetical protein [Simiduia aestuariiviva]|uniref:Transmembrane protein n=1 Tax=Simiduia aestuariiviva TaxID=1510459 RepID=A0A839UL23_9GAMM|nr:hypothetical protein [Simiduia aestuariiviva]MBB3167279.1 hypothetical protein [Simiduia aestuariiviva]